MLGGGLVFYNDGTGHGLVCAPSDQSAGIQWNNGSFTTTGATDKSVGAGNANTNIIVANQGSGSYAAKICADLVLNTYNDWYLPSLGELNLMYANLKVDELGGFANTCYWSSSERADTAAEFQNFSNGSHDSNWKSNLYCVRAVRSF